MDEKWTFDSMFCGVLHIIAHIVLVFLRKTSDQIMDQFSSAKQDFKNLGKMDNDRDDFTFTTLGGAAGGAGQQTFIVEHQVGFLTIMNF